ncbi:MAG: polyvinylalcohol dehydrogenase, partial [Verrucomicrobia bacterium]|nr:polyvinylalcohol dehydrogenase [Verrucomicrobiota bacterium]
MTSTSLRLPLALAFLALTSLPSKAGDWPQWRGPDRSDRSSEKNLLKKWPQEGPKKLWVFEKAGLGYSGFSTADGRLFTMGARDGKEVVIAIDAAKGTELWASPAGDVYSNHWGDGPRGTPTIESGKVYALGAQGNIVCLEATTGKEVWRASMTGMGGKVPGWGYCESLLVENGTVYCTPGGAQGAIAALDQNTGKVKWRTKDFTDEAHYSSIVPVDHNGARQLIQLSPKNVVGIDGRTGATLWTSPWPGRTAVIPTPIFK